LENEEACLHRASLGISVGKLDPQVLNLSQSGQMSIGSLSRHICGPYL